MERVQLNTKQRTKTGKGNSRLTRRQGEIPAILYGPGSENIMLSLNMMDFDRIYKKSRAGNMLFDLTIHNDGESYIKSAMIREVQKHPLSRKYLHIDFYEVSMDRKIRTKVPVVTKGKSKGVEFGGLLQVIRRELEILCFPNQIPEAIELDVTELEVGDAVHVRDIQPPEHVEIPADVNFTVVTVIGVKSAPKAPGEEGEAQVTEEAPAKTGKDSGKD